MSNPKVMYAMQLAENADGGYDVRYADDVPLPAVASTELLIKVAYAGVNHADLYQREGRYPLPRNAENIPGLECSGEVVAVGNDVSGFQLGDKVCALLLGGGYGEYCAVDASHVAHVPAGLNLAQAAALPEALATVWLTMARQAGLRKGEYVLIHGGSSGIGATAIQLAKLMGALPIATARTAEKCASCEKIGAIAINYKTDDFVQEVKRITDGRGVNVLLDMVGGDYMQRNLSAMAQGGRMVSIAFIKGAKIPMNMAPLLLKNLSWRGTTLGSQTDATKAAVLRDAMAMASAAIVEGVFSPLMDEEFLLCDSEKAHQRMDQSLHLGKIVLKICPSS